MSIIEQVSQTITHALTTDLSEFLADRFGLDANEVTNVINDYLGHISTPASPVKMGSTRKSPPTKSAISGVKTCGFRITRGDNEGQLCGTAIRGSGDFCSKHKNRKTVLAKTNGVTRDPTTKYWMITGTKYIVKSAQNKKVIGKIVGGEKVALTKADHKKIFALDLDFSE